MKLTNTVRNRVIATVKKNIADASKYYGRKFRMPKIEFTKRGMTAGVACCTTNTVNYNPVLLMENVEDFIARTVPHEVAHLIDYQVNPHNHRTRLITTRSGCIRRAKRNVHGRDFQFIMTHVLGCDDATRCHTYDVSSVMRNKKRHEWKCDDCGATMHLGPKRHKNMRFNRRSYRPRGCSFDHSYSYVGIVGQQPMAIAADAPKEKTVTTTKRPPGTSNKDIARVLFRKSTSRKEFVQSCIVEGIKKSTASTYYQNFKSGVWS